MILDATAGNRTMWQHKNTENIIYIDIEKRLATKPTIFADNTQTPFKNATFDTIFYDPPFTWESRGDPEIVYPQGYSKVKTQFGYFKFGYYGWEKFKTRLALKAHIYQAQHEFKRILKDNGLLWMKWNEMSITLNKILTLLTDWTLLLIVYVKSPTQTKGTHQTYWICMQKKKMDTEQSDLNQF